MQCCIKVQKTAINAVINVDFFRIILYNKVAKKILNSIKRINFTKALKKYNMPHKLINFPKNKPLTHAFSVFEPFLAESSETLKLMTNFLKKY